MEFLVTGRLFSTHPASVPGNSINHFKFIAARRRKTYGRVNEKITSLKHSSFLHVSINVQILRPVYTMGALLSSCCLE
jgi:hypothetical protein